MLYSRPRQPVAALFLLLGSLVMVSPLHAASFSSAGFFAVDGSPRVVKNFNPGWRFLKGDATGAEASGFDDTDWEAAHLPHGLEILGRNASGGRNYQGVAWYRKRFATPAPTRAEAGRVVLYFEAVMGHAQVWVNGQRVAEHFGGYLPFAADVTDVLRPEGAANVVAVRADNADSKLYPPGKHQGGLDFTYMGGIYRDTFLIQTGAVRVSLPELSATEAGGGVFAATLAASGDRATLEVRTEVANHGSTAEQLAVRTVLEDAGGREVAVLDQTLALAAGASEQLAGQMIVDGVKLWHPDTPHLHFVRTEVRRGDAVVDSLRTRIGLRLFEMRGRGGFYVNGEPIGHKVVGANRHQDHDHVGNALPNSGQYRDAKLLREGGCRIVRAGHYPLDPAFYDACDELGLLATTANPGWHFFNKNEPLFEQRLYEDTRALVRRDRNRPSMLLWETALNETIGQPPRVLNNMTAAAHAEFPFPGMFTATDEHVAKDADFDVHYHGTDPDVNSFNREYGDGGEVDNWKSQNATTRVNPAWGEVALRTAAVMQAAVLAQRYRTGPSRFGGSLWAGIDHQRGYHPDPFWGGLLTGAREPRYTWHLYRSQYRPDFDLPGIDTGPMVFVAHELTQLSPADVLVFSNCEAVRVTWLGGEPVTQTPSDNKAWASLPHPPFVFEGLYDFSVIKSQWRRKTSEIELVVEGLIGGEVVTRQVKNYAERTAGVALRVDGQGQGLAADGADFVPVRADIVDQDGVRKTLAQERVYFEVEGPGVVIGGPAQEANPAPTVRGTATALIRSTLEPGEITVRAYVDGLAAGETTLRSNTPALPLAYDAAYAAASRQPDAGVAPLRVEGGGDGAPPNVQALQAELERVRLELVGRTQDVMELRSQLSNPPR